MNSNSRVDRLTRREVIAKHTGKCPHCRPHRGENAARPNRTKSKAAK